MTQILTDEEIFKLQYELQYRDGGFHPIPFARAIEQAILNKLSEQEPVAWFDEKLGCFDEKHFDQLKPIYLHPAHSVPEGYQLVPIEPTEAMQKAGGHVNSEWLNDSAPIGENRYGFPMPGVWKAMLAAAARSA